MQFFGSFFKKYTVLQFQQKPVTIIQKVLGEGAKRYVFCAHLKLNCALKSGSSTLFRSA